MLLTIGKIRSKMEDGSVGKKYLDTSCYYYYYYYCYYYYCYYYYYYYYYIIIVVLDWDER